MTRNTALISVIALALGIQNILHYARYRRRKLAQPNALQTWESEGGAVPTSAGRTAAQVSPEPAATAEP